MPLTGKGPKRHRDCYEALHNRVQNPAYCELLEQVFHKALSADQLSITSDFDALISCRNKDIAGVHPVVQAELERESISLAKILQDRAALSQPHSLSKIEETALLILTKFDDIWKFPNPKRTLI